VTLALVYPDISPIAIEIGPFAIRWYAIAYIAGLVLGWRYVRHLCGRVADWMTRVEVDDLLLWTTLGVVLGGRLGYVLFYRPSYYLSNPLEILAMWEGGMSFHGGLIGVILAMILFARARGRSFWTVADPVACATPIGLFFGRIANFVNGELYGRITDSPLGMVFPHAGPEPRHPSQLYEATLEGLVLFAVLAVLAHRTRLSERRGALSGMFLIGYGLSRIVAELMRQPDDFLGFIGFGLTMGQILSVPMVLMGALFVWQSYRRPVA
tara:strand:+ start:75 stop:875 length:801 start_codon:yes stop_codon:yes gene_type:complete